MASGRTDHQLVRTGTIRKFQRYRCRTDSNIGRPCSDVHKAKLASWPRGDSAPPNNVGHMIPHYANAVRAEPGLCWRMVSRPTGYQAGAPTDCFEPVRWIGRAMVGKKRMRLWSCEGHSEGLEDLRPIRTATRGTSTRNGLRPTSVSKPTRTCVRYATKCLSPGRMVVDKNPMIPNERHLSGDQSSEEEAQGGAGRT